MRGNEVCAAVPNVADATRSRWPTHSRWLALASVDWESSHSILLDKCSNARNPTELRLLTVVLGSLTSFMAMHNIDDRNEGIDTLLRKLYEHYSTVPWFPLPVSAASVAARS